MKKRTENDEAPEEFPLELLKQPKAKWLEYFKSYGVNHPAFEDARKKLMRVII
jgi:hypothetical protein